MCLFYNIGKALICFSMGMVLTLTGSAIRPGVAATTHRYVDASVADSGDGLTWATAWKTISEAAEAALLPGTVVHIRPGVYRETVAPQTSGTSAAPITFRAEDRPDTVYVVGSETAGTLGEAWQPLSAYTGTRSLQPGVATSAIHFVDAAWTWEQPWDVGDGTLFPIESDLLALPTYAGERWMWNWRRCPPRSPN